VLPATSAAVPLFVPAAVERAEPTLIAAREVLERFHSLIRLKDAARLDPWIVTAARTKLAAFAAGVDAGKDAVAAAISTPWSSGQVEGTICRLKSINRQMSGRAKLDLRKARMMVPASAICTKFASEPFHPGPQKLEVAKEILPAYNVVWGHVTFVLMHFP